MQALVDSNAPADGVADRDAAQRQDVALDEETNVEQFERFTESFVEAALLRSERNRDGVVESGVVVATENDGT